MFSILEYLDTLCPGGANEMAFTELNEDKHREAVLLGLAHGRVTAALPDGYSHRTAPVRFPLAGRTRFEVSILGKPGGPLPDCYYVSTGTAHFYVMSTL